MKCFNDEDNYLTVTMTVVIALINLVVRKQKRKITFKCKTFGEVYWLNISVLKYTHKSSLCRVF